jgi:hypothetical protein
LSPMWPQRKRCWSQVSSRWFETIHKHGGRGPLWSHVFPFGGSIFLMLFCLLDAWWLGSPVFTLTLCQGLLAMWRM